MFVCFPPPSSSLKVTSSFLCVCVLRVSIPSLLCWVSPARPLHETLQTYSKGPALLSACAQQPIFLALSEVKRWLSRPWEQALKWEFVFKRHFLVVLINCTNPYPEFVMWRCRWLLCPGSGRRADLNVSRHQRGHRCCPLVFCFRSTFIQKGSELLWQPQSQTEGFVLKLIKAHTLRAFLSSSQSFRFFLITGIASEQMGL